MKAFDNEVFEWLKNDSNIRRCGYSNKSTNNSSINAYTLVVDGEDSCKLDEPSIKLADACQQGPWMSTLKKSFENPHLLAMEVQMNGSLTNGAWHVDVRNFQILTVVVPLNSAYHHDRGGCTEIRDEQGNSILLECNVNEFAIFDGSCLHRRTASTSKVWSKRRRTVFMHFATSRKKWESVCAARSVHTRLKNKNKKTIGKKIVHNECKRVTRSQKNMQETRSVQYKSCRDLYKSVGDHIKS